MTLARPQATDAGEPVLAIPIGPDVTIVVRPGSELARVGRLSRHAQLHRVACSIVEAAAERSLLGDWGALALYRCSPSISTETEDLFLSYAQFCREVGAAPADRLSFAAFGRAMTSMGWPAIRVAAGRSLRPGCGLREGAIEAAVRPYVELSDWANRVGDFLDRECVQGDDAVRARAPGLYQGYRDWAAAADIAPLSRRQFVQGMRARGFRQKRSNGIWWVGVRMGTSINPRAPVGAARSAISNLDGTRDLVGKWPDAAQSPGLPFCQ